MAYTVFRCDDMPGIDNRTFNKSVLVQDANGNNIDVENGTIVEIGGLVPGQHDLYVAHLATSSSNVADCAVLGAPEVIYTDLYNEKNLDAFINKAGVPVLAYLLSDGGIFSVTKEGFVGGTAPSLIGAGVGIGANGKIDASGSSTGLGEVIEIKTSGRYTYYAIRL